MSISSILLHWVSASVMLWGYAQLDTLITDDWFEKHAGGHWEYLTNLG